MRHHYDYWKARKFNDYLDRKHGYLETDCCGKDYWIREYFIEWLNWKYLGHLHKSVPLTPEEIQRRDKLAEELKVKTERGRELLKVFLTSEEFAKLCEAKQAIDIISTQFENRLYQVSLDGSVGIVENGKKIGSLCLIPKSGDFIPEDKVLARIALLSFNEKKFLEEAKYTPLC